MGISCYQPQKEKEEEKTDSEVPESAVAVEVEKKDETDEGVNKEVEEATLEMEDGPPTVGKVLWILPAV